MGRPADIFFSIRCLCLYAWLNCYAYCLIFFSWVSPCLISVWFYSREDLWSHSFSSVNHFKLMLWPSWLSSSSIHSLHQHQPLISVLLVFPIKSPWQFNSIWPFPYPCPLSHSISCLVTVAKKHCKLDFLLNQSFENHQRTALPMFRSFLHAVVSHIDQRQALWNWGSPADCDVNSHWLQENN